MVRLIDFVFSAGGGFLFGALSGYAIKKVTKVVAIVACLFVSVLAYLSYKGLIDIKWVALDNVTTSTSNISQKAVHALNNTSSQFATHSSLLQYQGCP